MAYCWDCEIELDAGALCRSCQLHRSACPAPQYYEEPVYVTDARGREGRLYHDADGASWVRVGRYYYQDKRGYPTDPQPAVMAWYCHGAGPDGYKVGLLDEAPRPVNEDECGPRRPGARNDWRQEAQSRMKVE